MRKILLLGGSTQQIPAIVYAKSIGLFTILCDFIPDNPGQHYADQFFCISTTDKEAILQVAETEGVEGIVSYASDPAAPTAAYVAEKLGLPTNPYKSVQILSQKDQFRIFLKENGFNCPHAESFTTKDAALSNIRKFNLPIMIKPNDSSGSKGVNRANDLDVCEKYIDLAFENSRQKMIIIEEFIVQDHPYMIAGDCFVEDGEVVFWGFLNSHREKTGNPFVPVGTSYPMTLSPARIERVKEAIERLFRLLDIQFGAFNIEVMIDQNEDVYIVEIGPRNGGNMIPDLLYMATGIDTIAATVDHAMGLKYAFSKPVTDVQFLATRILHTLKKGILKDIEFDDVIQKKIFKTVMYKDHGDAIDSFDGSNKAIGIIFLKFDEDLEMRDFLEHAEKHIQINVEEIA